MATGARRVFRSLAVWGICLIVLPSVILLAFEGGLRAVGYGVPMRPFINATFDGQAYVIRNLNYVRQFFPWEIPMHQLEYVEHVISVKRPENTYRVFVFGESTPEGWPEPRFSFARYLRVMLEARYPGVNFEICNMAFRAVNSHVMRPAAEACAELEPDLFIVYLGNNEIHGPYTPCKDAEGRPLPLIPLPVIRANIALNESRVFQGVTEARKRVMEFSGIKDPRSQWYKHLCTYWDDPRVPQAFRNYQTNLEAICKAGSGAGAQVIVCTVPVNLRNWMPVNSRHRPDIQAEAEKAWTALFDAGKVEQEKGEYESALETYTRALAIDGTFAETHFRMGQCLWRLERYQEAKKCFEDALEYDSYFWVRSRKRTNEIILDVAGRPDNSQVHLADVRAAISRASEHGCPGLDFFLDECHLNVEGSYQFARSVFETVVPLLPVWVTSKESKTSEIPALDDCRRILLTSSPYLATYLTDFLGSPSSRNIDDPEPLQKLLEEATDKHIIVSAAEADIPVFPFTSDYLRLYSGPKRMCAAPLLYAYPEIPQEQTKEILKQTQYLYGAFPHHRGSMRLLAKGKAIAGDFCAAETILREVLYIFGHDPIVISDLASVLLAQKRFSEANAIMKDIRVQDCSKDDLKYAEEQRLYIAASMGNLDVCGRILAEAESTDSEQGRSYVRVNFILKDQVDPPRNVAFWAAITEKRPEDGAACYFLAKAQETVGDTEAARQSYRKAIACNLAGDELLIDLGMRLDALGDTRTSAQVLAAVVERNPQTMPRVSPKLAEIYGKCDDWSSAERILTKSVIQNPTQVPLLMKLDLVLNRPENTMRRFQVWKSVTDTLTQDSPALYYLGRCMLEADDKDGARVAFSRAAAVQTADPGFNGAVGVALLESGECKLAVDVIRGALDANPEKLGYLRKSLIGALEQAGDTASLQSNIMAAVATDPSDVELYKKLHACLARSQDASGRLDTWRKLAGDYPAVGAVNYYLGVDLDESDDKVAAREAWLKAATGGVKDPELMTALGLALMKANEPGLTVGLLTDAIAANPRDCGFARPALVEALEKTGDTAGVQRVVLEITGNDPANEHMWAKLDECLAMSGDAAARLSVWSSLGAKNPESPAIQYHLAIALKDSGNPAGALELLRKAATREGIGNMFAARVGMALAELGDSTMGISLMQKALEHEPETAGFVRMPLVEALEKAGTTGDTERLLLESLQTDSMNPVIYHKLEAVFSRRGDSALRATAWKGLVDKDPENARVQYHLAKALGDMGDVAGALTALRKAAVKPVKDAGFTANLGLALAGLGDPILAVEVLRRALSINAAEVAFVRGALVEALHKAGDDAAAMKAIEDAQAAGVTISEKLRSDVMRSAKQ